MTWLPGSNYTNELYSNLKEIGDNLCHEKIPLANSYYAVLVRVSSTLTALQADYNDFTLTKQIPSLQTFFLMEKVLVDLPINSTKDHPTEIIIVYEMAVAEQWETIYNI